MIMTPFWAIGYPIAYNTWVTTSEMKTFKGTVAASISQSGIGTAKNRKHIGNANTRKTFQPASDSTQPTITGIAENTSTVNTPCVRAKNIRARPEINTAHPASGAGATGVALRFWRDCHTSQTAAATISGP